MKKILLITLAASCFVCVHAMDTTDNSDGQLLSIRYRFHAPTRSVGVDQIKEAFTNAVQDAEGDILQLMFEHKDFPTDTTSSDLLTHLQNTSLSCEEAEHVETARRRKCCSTSKLITYGSWLFSAGATTAGIVVSVATPHSTEAIWSSTVATLLSLGVGFLSHIRNQRALAKSAKKIATQQKIQEYLQQQPINPGPSADNVV